MMTYWCSWSTVDFESDGYANCFGSAITFPPNQKTGLENGPENFEQTITANKGTYT